MNKLVTRVEIYDQPYNIAGENDADYVRRLAAAVDAKMRLIARQARLADSLRVAILTAMNLADELEMQRSHNARLEQAIHDKSAACHAVLDRALGRAV